MSAGAAHDQVQIPKLKTSLMQRSPRALRRFLAVLFILSSVKSIQALIRQVRTGHLDEWKNNNLASIKLALFPAAVPEVFSLLKQQLHEFIGLPELLSSPLILLLSPALRVQAALYASSSALYHTGQNSKWRRALPPAWTLNVIGNAWLLWAFLLRSKAFPKTYEKIIFSHSTQYVPKGTSKAEIEQYVLDRVQTKGDGFYGTHQNSLCAKLHPREPSCLINYLKAMAIEIPRASLWVGAFSLLPIIMSKARLEMVRRDPGTVLKGWAISTLRGSAFVVGSINTSWAMICLCQRVLPHDTLKQARWFINGAVGSLWILVLPAKRRTEFALYVARLAALCAWRVWRLEGGASVPYGEVALFALSWAHLARLKAKGVKVAGLVGIGMKQLDAASGINQS